MKNQGPDIPWSDLEMILAIRRAGTLRAAAHALGVTHPTVSRRVAELQEGLGVALFEREGRRLRLTEAGQDLADTAERIESEVDGLGRRIAGQDHRLEGLVRIACSPAMISALAPVLPGFYADYPRIRLELVTGLGFASLTRREADVAIRQTNAPQETLLGRRVSLFEGAAYASTALVERLRASGSLDPYDWPWVDWDEAHSHHDSARWLAQTRAASKIVARADSALAMFQLVRSGVGVGYAPTMLASPDPGLMRLGPPEEFPSFCREIWVLTHPDLRTSGRVRATTNWLTKSLSAPGKGVWPGYSHEEA